MKRALVALLFVAGCGSGGHDSPVPSASASPKPVAAPAPAPPAAPSCAPGCNSLERCEAGRCLPACGEGEVYVPATGPGGFEMGLQRLKFVQPLLL